MLAVQQTQNNIMDTWQVMKEQAEYLVKSGFMPYGINNANQVIAIMMKGRELGIEAWQALSTINVIKGKPTVSPQLMLALIKRSKQLENIRITGDDTQCTVVMKRLHEDSHTTTFTMEDAIKLKLATKDNWKSQPKVMLQWRAVAACARVVFPDVVLGMYTPEEMGADVIVTDDGDMTIIEAEMPEQPTPPATPKAETLPAGQLTADEVKQQVEGKAETTLLDRAMALLQDDVANVIYGGEYKSPKYASEAISDACEHVLKDDHTDDELYHEMLIYMSGRAHGFSKANVLNTLGVVKVKDFFNAYTYGGNPSTALAEAWRELDRTHEQNKLLAEAGNEPPPLVEDTPEPVTVSVEHVGIAKVNGKPQIKTMTGGLHNVTLDSLKALELTLEQVDVDGGYAFMLPKQVRMFTPEGFGKPSWLEPMPDATPEPEPTTS